MADRASEKRDWQSLEWQQADQRNIWSGDARRPDYHPYSLVEEYLVFGYWVVESEDDEVLGHVSHFLRSSEP